ncbi:DinB family protein ['Paenibacillus yunnanensis' Narsing Rao et al. 2020]|uniref:DinB family protein n=1 Tax=Paenibacillus tengchongensis TaxID=2608684 RepID=UPI00124CCE52|nr:DinB family protein [Paenibacillus tengchongensis]
MSEIITECMRKLDQSLGYLQVAVRGLPVEKIWHRPRPKMNAIGNLCLHLAGNEAQHLGGAIGGSGVVRDRPGEFLTRGGMSGEALLDRLRTVRDESWSVVRGLTAADLERVVTVYYPENSGVESYQWSIQKVLIGTAEHFAYHTGQIVYASRWLQDEDIHLLNWKHYD